MRKSSKTYGLIGVFLMAFALCSFAFLFNVSFESPPFPEFDAPVSLGSPIGHLSHMIHSAYGTENGCNMLYTAVSGHPATFMAYNIDLDQVEFTGAIGENHSDSWSQGVDSNGNVYIACTRNAGLYRYSPLLALPVENAGFEELDGANDPAGWTISTTGTASASIDTSNGTNALKLNDDDSSGAVVALSSSIPVPENSLDALFTLQFRAKRVGADVSVGIRTYDENGVQISSNRWLAAAAEPDWTLKTQAFHLDGTIPMYAGRSYRDIRSARIVVYSTVSGTNMTGCFDDFSLTTKGFAALGIVSPETTLWSICFDEDNNVYMGTFPNAKVIRYNCATDDFTDYGTVFPNQQYVRSQIYHNGFIYAGGIGTPAKFCRLDVDTGTVTELPGPQKTGVIDPEQITSYYAMSCVRDTVFAYIELNGGSSYIWAMYDLVEQKWLNDNLLPNALGMCASPEFDGKTYLTYNADSAYKLYQMDLNNLSAMPVDTGISYASSLRGSKVIQIPDNPLFPGNTLVTVHYSKGKVALMNFQNKSITYVSNPDMPVTSYDIQTVGKGPTGDIYVSGYMGSEGGRLHMDTGQFDNFTLSQAEGMIAYMGKMYFGVYPGARIYAYDPELPYSSTNPEKIIDQAGENQDRPFAFAAGDGKVFIGTIADYGYLTGALTVYDAITGEYESFGNVVSNQSIMGLAYKDGKLYGSTTIWGGYGIDPVETQAKIFVWDVAGKEKLTEFIPAFTSEMDGYGQTLMGLGDLSFGPYGLLWCASKGLVFAIDPNTYQVVKSRQIHDVNWRIDGVTWRPTYIRWNDKGQFFTNPNGKLFVVNPYTLDYKQINDDAAYRFDIGGDGNLYYGSGTQVFKLPAATPQ